MHRIVIVVAMLSLAIALVPATASSARHHRPAGTSQAAKACRAEHKADPAAFKAKYANKNGKRAFRRCVRQHVVAARKKCRAERKADPAAFKAKYANSNGKNAFRRCVRQHAGDPVS
jgi:hypothetical protein